MHNYYKVANRRFIIFVYLLLEVVKYLIAIGEHFLKNYLGMKLLIIFNTLKENFSTFYALLLFLGLIKEF